MTLKIIRSAAMRHPVQERGKLAIEKVWMEEADRRYKAYRLGQIEAIPAEEVIASLRASLKK